MTVLLGEATGDRPGRSAAWCLRDGELAYDSLIVATGATHSYFGHDEWAVHAPGLKTLEDALEIRAPRAARLRAGGARDGRGAPEREWLTFVVVGAGPTGVELAGTLAEIARHTLRARLPAHRPAAARA